MFKCHFIHRTLFILLVLISLESQIVYANYLTRGYYAPETRVICKTVAIHNRHKYSHHKKVSPQITVTYIVHTFGGETWIFPCCRNTCGPYQTLPTVPAYNYVQFEYTPTNDDFYNDSTQFDSMDMGTLDNDVY